MSNPDSKEPATFPANVVIYVQGEIDQRTKYKRELEALRDPGPHMEVKHLKWDIERKRLQDNIDNLARVIISITQKHLPGIEIDSNDNEISIANILSALPPPHELRRVTQVSARGQV